MMYIFRIILNPAINEERGIGLHIISAALTTFPAPALTPHTSIVSGTLTDVLKAKTLPQKASALLLLPGLHPQNYQ